MQSDGGSPQPATGVAAAQLYELETSGFVILRRVFDDEVLLAALRADIDRAIEEDRRRYGSAKRFQDIVHLLFGRGDSFVELLEKHHPAPLIEAWVGKSCVIHSYNAVRLTPDAPNNASTIHRDSARFSPFFRLSVQALYMVDDFTVENGATYLLPGSHHREARPSDEQFFENAARATGRAGDCVVFDSMVWHCGGRNVSSLPRRAITSVYTRSFMKQQIDLPRAIPDSVRSGFSPKLRRLIGMDTRVPASLDEFYLPDAERLYKSGQG